MFILTLEINVHIGDKVYLSWFSWIFSFYNELIGKNWEFTVAMVPWPLSYCWNFPDIA